MAGGSRWASQGRSMATRSPLARPYPFTLFIPSCSQAKRCHRLLLPLLLLWGVFLHPRPAAALWIEAIVEASVVLLKFKDLINKAISDGFVQFDFFHGSKISI
uniref:Uncharacterized protein n=1 Tax=Arundo donax TaxID=35708 RepID=A0A0A8YD68_ARUDO